MIRINNLSATYQQHRINFPNWEVPQAGQQLILGNSGSGKTTLLHLLAGIIAPATGNIYIGNTDLTALTNSGRDKFRGQNIGLVFQQAHLVDAVSLIDNLLMAQYFAGLPQDKQRAINVLDELGIGDKKNDKPHQLSQGQAQRASIARALLNKPKTILADEPTASLDDTNCQTVLSLLQEAASRHNTTLVIATHDQRVKDVFPEYLQLE